MKKLVLLTTLKFLGIICKAQESPSKLDVRFSFGTSLLGTGDIQIFMIENELNLRLSKYWTVSGGLGYAKTISDIFETGSFIQANTNIYISPFKNDGNNDFRLGTGLSWYTFSDIYQSSATYQNGQLIYQEYEFDNRKSIGVNVIIENTYLLSSKYMIGIKLFSQPYKNGDLNSGILLKFGAKI
jgi:hypothetical protein